MSAKSFRSDSYRKPYGVRERSDSGYGYGKRSSTNASSRAREVPSGVSLTDASQDAWGRVAVEIRSRLHPAAWSLYCVQLPLIGERKNALYIAGDYAIAEWTRRKYASAIGEIVREVTDYEGVFVCDRREAP